MKKNLFSLLLLGLVCMPGMAKVKLPEIISNHMVLQQQTEVKLWGTAKAEQFVMVTPSWSNKTFRTKSDSDGNWLIKISTPAAGYHTYSITFSDGEKTVINDILIGEVWFCSGQSNMQMPLNGYWGCPVLNANEDIAYSGQYKGIRYSNTPHIAALTPQKTVDGDWKLCNPENAPDFSAAAFHFAVSLNKVLDVPVGIINCSWGGSTVEGWLPKDILEKYPDVDLSQAGSKTTVDYMQPMIMYNGMLKPLENYTIKGFLWYQGESNVGRDNTYAQRLATMVKLWREEWGLGQLPFYEVEIAPYDYGKNNIGAYLREAQFNALSLIPNSGMISTNDLVEPFEKHNIHPRNKTLVGKRLSYLALVNTYGIKGICDKGPVYKSMEIENGKIVLSFYNAENGFNHSTDLKGFEIAGADKIFHPATAQVYKSLQIIVSNDSVPQPTAVRYCFQNFQIGNVCNHRELPLVPFRTDNYK